MVEIAKIDKGVPIPEKKTNGNVIGITPSLRQLAVGDSFVMHKSRRPAITVAIGREQFRNGTTFVTRLVENNQVRIWRIM